MVKPVVPGLYPVKVEAAEFEPVLNGHFAICGKEFERDFTVCLMQLPSGLGTKSSTKTCTRWNGSQFNAAEFFTIFTPGNHTPRSTVDHFDGSLEEPIRHTSCSSFPAASGTASLCRFVSATTVPTPSFQQYVLPKLLLSGRDAVTGSTLALAAFFFGER